MTLHDYKVTEQERKNNGVVSAPDTLTGKPEENKSVFDKLVGFLADKYNLALGVIADELSNRYTKAETEQAISDRVVQVGAGDMAKRQYDKNNNGIVDNAEQINGFTIELQEGEPFIRW